ncbi:MAG TPA: DUF6249 domain-containing protein [Prolixibacteraceae bacterium]|nr:DUF6249 domain-containing protein [Prolixibacteraceae bacterium]
MNNLDELIPIVLFLSIFASLYVFLTTRNKERLALIEKGGDPSLFKHREATSGYSNFKYGLFLIGIALGIMAGYFLNDAGMDEGPAYFSMIFLFGGIGLVVSFLLQEKLVKK